MKSLLALATLLLASLLVAPWLVGAQVERRYPVFLVPLDVQGFERLGHRYQRGWFSAQAWTRYGGLRAADGTTLSPAFTVYSRIEHGPWPWSQLRRGDWRPRAARIETRTMGAGERPSGGTGTQLDLMVALDGSGSARIVHGTLHWPEGNRLPGVEAIALQGSLDFGPDNSWSRVRADCRRVELVQGHRWRLALRDLSLDLDHTAAFQALPLPVGRLSVGEARLLSNALEGDLVLRGVEVTAASSAETALLDLTIVHRVSELRLGGEVYGPAEIRLRVAGLSGPGLAQVGETLRAAWLPLLARDASAAAHLDTLAAEMIELLDHRPSLWGVVQVTAPEDWLQAEIALRPTGLRGRDAPRPVLADLSGEAELNMPESLPRKILTGWLRSRLPEQKRPGTRRAPTSQELETQIAVAVERQLGRLLRQQLLVPHGEELRMRARLGGGLLAINGRTFPLRPDAPSP